MVSRLGWMCLLAVFCHVAAAATDAQEITNKAIELASAGREAEALGYFQEAVEVAPNNAAHHSNLGVCYMRLGKLAKSRESFARALEQDPRSDDAVANAADLVVRWPGAGFEELLRQRGLTESIPLFQGALQRAQKEYEARKSAAASGHGGGGGGEMRPTSKVPDSLAELNTEGPVPSLEEVHRRFRQSYPSIEHTIQPLPRIPLSQLHRPEHRVYMLGKAPFLLEGVGKTWKSWDERGGWWQKENLASVLGSTPADFYRQNLREQGRPVFIVPWEKAIHQQRELAASGQPNYIQMNLTPKHWRTLAPYVGSLPFRFELDDAWLDACLPEDDFREEFFLTNHWRMILLGTKGAGMFNHKDSLHTSSYQFQLTGRKMWHLCSDNQTALLDRAFEQRQDMFRPDYSKLPELRRLRCYVAVIEPGEALFYPKDYWHQTINLDDDTMSITGTIVDEDNYRDVRRRFEQQCASPSNLGYIHASQELCDRLHRCYYWWEVAFGGASSFSAAHARADNATLTEDEQEFRRRAPGVAAGGRWCPRTGLAEIRALAERQPRLQPLDDARLK